MKSKTTVKKSISTIAEIVSYGLGHLGLEDGPFEDNVYNVGGIETLGHMAACCITQWITNDATGTGETIESLHLMENPTRAQLEKYIAEYVTALIEA